MRQWAPLVWLAPGEKFMPSSVTDFLHHVHAEKSKTPVKNKPSAAGNESGSAEDDDDDDSIPQTGILWWPAEALAVAGIVIFTIGWRRRFGDGGDHHAS